jgi:hypothetical protein
MSNVHDPDNRRALDLGSTIKLIGREDVNDLEAILAVSNTDLDAIAHTVHSDYDTLFT